MSPGVSDQGSMESSHGPVGAWIVERQLYTKVLYFTDCVLFHFSHLSPPSSNTSEDSWDVEDYVEGGLYILVIRLFIVGPYTMHTSVAMLSQLQLQLWLRLAL